MKDSDLAGLKTVFGWAMANKLLPINPAQGITIKLGKRPRLRSKGFTDKEAIDILTAALAVEAATKTKAALHWVPWLAAYTGARAGELAQLRRQDVEEINGILLLKITPEAGTVKTNEARIVPLHSHVRELGFATFVDRSGPESATSTGHLFLRVSPTGNVLGPLQGVKNRLAEFSRCFV